MKFEAIKAQNLVSVKGNDVKLSAVSHQLSANHLFSLDFADRRQMTGKPKSAGTKETVCRIESGMTGGLSDSTVRVEELLHPWPPPLRGLEKQVEMVYEI